VYVLDVYRRQVEVPQQARDALEFQRRNYGAMMWVESVGGFKAVPQLIRDLAPGVLIGEITPRGDKRQRAERIASAWNDGRVLLPKTDPHLPGSDMAPPWLAEYVDEVQRFTGRTGGQDDQVDASANAFNEVVELKNEVQVHRGAVRDPARWG
jgi:predicted phage terminase large subunit-like protein